MTIWEYSQTLEQEHNNLAEKFAQLSNIPRYTLRNRDKKPLIRELECILEHAAQHTQKNQSLTKYSSKKLYAPDYFMYQ